MSQVFTYLSPGQWTENLGTATARAGRIPGLVQSAELGQPAMSTLVLDNPDGTLGHSGDQITGWKMFTVDEDAETAGDQRTYTGYITNRTYRRGSGDSSLRLGVANEIEMTLIDLNEVLGFHIITGTDGSRPSETVSDRMTWILASTYLTGLVYDNGFVAASSVTMDATDYRGQKPVDVLGDLAVAASYNFFVYYDETAAQASLWFGNSNTSALYDSGMLISNVLADIDQAAIVAGTATTFYAEPDATLTRSPALVYSGAYLPYAKGAVYVTDATIESNFIGRDGSAPNANIKDSATATTIATRFLSDNATEDDRILCTLRVSAIQANAIKAGQLVTARFSHFPGWEAGKSARVMRKTLVQDELTDQWYRMPLELSPTTPVASIVQTINWDTGAGGAAATFASPVTAGNLLIFSVANRAGGTSQIATDMASFLVNNAVGRNIGVTGFGAPDYAEVSAGVGSDGAGIGYATAVGDEQTIWLGQLNAQITVYEVTGATTAGAEVKALSNQASSAGKSLGSWSSPGSLQFTRYAINTDDNVVGASTPGTGWFIDQQIFVPYWYGGWPHPQAPSMHCSSGDAPLVTGDALPWGAVAVALAAA